MKRIFISVFISILSLVPTLVLAGEVYKWIDEKGIIYLSDDLYQVPEKFRDRVERMIVPDRYDEPIQPLEKVPSLSISEPERPKAEPSRPRSGFIPFEKFKHLTEGMTEAEVLSRFGPPTQEVKDEVEVKGYYTQRGMVRKETLVKRYYYIGDPDLGERTTVIHFRSGVVTKIERIFPPTW